MSEAGSAEWRDLKFGALCQRIVNGGTPATDIPNFWNGQTPWVTGADFTPSGIGEIRRFVSAAGVRTSATSVVKAGNLLVVTRTGVGKLAIAPFDIAISQDVSGVYVDAEMAETSFVFYLLSRELDELKKLNQGTSINGIIRADLERHPVRIPSSKAVQRKIAAILTSIDIVIEKTEALIAKCQQIKAGLMHDLFTRGVLPNGQLRPPRTDAPELYQETAIGWIPRDWTVVRMVELAEERKGSTTIGPFGSDLVANDYRLEGVPIVFVRDVKEAGFEWNSDTYVSKMKAVQLSAHIVKAGDVLATKMGLPPCISCLYPEWMPNGVITADMIRLTPNATLVDGYWLTTAINQDRVKRQVAAITAGVTRLKVTLADFRGIRIAKPDLNEQRLISVRLHAAQDKSDAEMTRVGKLRRQKLGLMQDLLSGKVPVKVDTTVEDTEHG
jgi:type I restriction enzyme S subunit